MSKSQQSLQTETRLQQRLSPMQVQFVRLLAMSGPEVEDEVQRALDEMPALEAVDPSESDLRADAPTEGGDSFTETADEMQRADFADPDDMPDYIKPTSDGVRDLIPVRIPLAAQARGDDYVEPVATNAEETLMEALRRQLSEIHLDADVATAADYIIGSLDPNGYLTRPLRALADDLAINEGVEIPMPAFEEALKAVQAMEPAGVGAVDLRECLILQLERMPRSAGSLTALAIVRDYFPELSKRHFQRIAAGLDISEEAVEEAVEVISRLNPKPGSAYATDGLPERSRHIIPDFVVEADDNGKLTLTMPNRIPELRVEASFAADDTAKDDHRLAKPADARSEAARAFVRTKRDDALNFIQVIARRQQTLFRVMSVIVKLQRDFFLSDEDTDLHPMVLRDVAALTGYDLSTIARATQGKYVATVHGIYPLKKFFNEKVSASDETLTSHRVNERLRAVVAKEDGAHPLSDREITDRLQAEGFDISRRTVAKYREQLGIPPARLRKR